MMHFILRIQIKDYQNKVLLHYSCMYSIVTNTALVTKAQQYNHHIWCKTNATTKFKKNLLWCTHHIWQARNAVINILSKLM